MTNNQQAVPAVVTSSDFTPAEFLMMEVLAARYRLGETHWTFPTRQRPTAVRLEKRNLVSWKSGVAENTIVVWLSVQGQDLWLSEPYYPPSGTCAISVEDLKSLEDANSLLGAACSQDIAIKELSAKMDEQGASVEIVSGGEGITHPGLRLLAAAAFSLLELDGKEPPNYHTAEFNGRLASGDKYFLEVASCKSEKQTPHALRKQAEKERDAALGRQEAAEKERDTLRAELEKSRERVNLLEGFADDELCSGNMSESEEERMREALSLPRK